jgi:hypothetical protein
MCFKPLPKPGWVALKKEKPFLICVPAAEKCLSEHTCISNWTHKGFLAALILPAPDQKREIEKAGL